MLIGVDFNIIRYVKKKNTMDGVSDSFLRA
jgi:hypothetical protein